jgi:hypothetical protein
MGFEGEQREIPHHLGPTVSGFFKARVFLVLKKPKGSVRVIR